MLCVRGAVLALDFAWAAGELVLCARLEHHILAVWPEDPARGLPSRCSETSFPVMLAVCPGASPGMPSAVGEEGTHASASAQATLCWVSPGTGERAWLCRPAVGCASPKAMAPTHSHPVPRWQLEWDSVDHSLFLVSVVRRAQRGRCRQTRPWCQPGPAVTSMKNCSFSWPGRCSGSLPRAPSLICPQLARQTMMGGSP